MVDSSLLPESKATYVSPKSGPPLDQGGLSGPGSSPQSSDHREPRAPPLTLAARKALTHGHHSKSKPWPTPPPLIIGAFRSPSTPAQVRLLWTPRLPTGFCATPSAAKVFPLNSFTEKGYYQGINKMHLLWWYWMFISALNNPPLVREPSQTKIWHCDLHRIYVCKKSLFSKSWNWGGRLITFAH